MLNKFKTVLVLAPHTDDGEFGAGGTIAKLTRLGCRVIYVAFSAAEQSVLPHLPSDILRREVKSATKLLGIKNKDCLVLDFEVRKFPEARQEILQKMIDLNKSYSPDLVILPSEHDTHQDHLTIFSEGFRAFKKSTMLAYEVPWNNRTFDTECFVILDEFEINAKKRSLHCYKSQEHRQYANAEYLYSLAKTRGTQVGREYAECFEVVRWIID